MFGKKNQFTSSNFEIQKEGKSYHNENIGENDWFCNENHQEGVHVDEKKDE